MGVNCKATTLAVEAPLTNAAAIAWPGVMMTGLMLDCDNADKLPVAAGGTFQRVRLTEPVAVSLLYAGTTLIS